MKLFEREHVLEEWDVDPWDDVDRTGSIERLRRQTRPVKWLAFTALALLVVGVLIAGAVGYWYMGKINPSGDPGSPVNFTVNADDTLETLSERLEAEGLVADAGVFRWYVERKGGLEITPGYYELRPNDHMGNVMGRLNTPPALTYSKVTFPEGFTLAQMSARVDRDVPRMTEADFAAALADPSVRSSFMPPGATSLEGMLFPDTYQVSNADSERQLVERMIGLMERVGRQEDIVEKSAQLGQDPYTVLIVASMIEREAKVDEDRAKIARVIYNRLYLGMLLQIDATLYYGQDPQTPFDQLRATDTPYNTYLYPGLPPTPIANPGRASIQAALNPAQNPTQGDPICVELKLRKPDAPCLYLYYVLANEEGGHAFGADDVQHAENVRRARAAGLLG
jgi:UPF0755 protein